MIFAGVKENDIPQVFEMLQNTNILQHQGLFRSYSLKAVCFEDDILSKNSPFRDDKYLLLKKPL